MKLRVLGCKLAIKGGEGGEEKGKGCVFHYCAPHTRRDASCSKIASFLLLRRN